MADNFEIQDGAVAVVGKNGQRRPISTPPGFTDIVFRNALATVYTLFTRDGKFPTPLDCFSEWSKIPIETYAALYSTPEFQEALEYRGVKWEQGSGLTLEQRNVLLMLSDLSDTRSLKTKLTEMSVPWARYQAWLKDPLFVAERQRQTTSAYGDVLPELRQVAISKALSGDARMLELIFAKTGEYDPRAQDQMDARSIVLAAMDSIQRRVHDPDVRAAIKEDIQTAIIGLELAALPARREIER